MCDAKKVAAKAWSSCEKSACSCAKLLPDALPDGSGSCVALVSSTLTKLRPDTALALAPRGVAGLYSALAP